MSNTRLLCDITAFLNDTGVPESTFCRLVGNHRLLERLRTAEAPGVKPARIWPETEIKIRAVMMTERERRVKSSAFA